jgi:hypothetical protein
MFQNRPQDLESARLDASVCREELQGSLADKADLADKLNAALESAANIEKKCREARTCAWTAKAKEEERAFCRRLIREELKQERENAWERAWAQQDHGLCVKACDMMRTAACKVAFNFFPFKGYLLDCE